MDLLRRMATGALAIAGSLLACAPRQDGGPPAHGMALPFIENDFASALARAREAHRPLFVEVWAPW